MTLKLLHPLYCLGVIYMKISVNIKTKFKTPIIAACLIIALLPLTLLLLSIARISETRDILAEWRPAAKPADAISYDPTASLEQNMAATLSRCGETAILGGAGGTSKKDPQASYYGRGWTTEGQWWQLSDISTSGYERVELSFTVKSSDTGPKNFALEYSKDGQNWLSLTDDKNVPIKYTIDPGTKFQQQGPYRLSSAVNDRENLFIRFINTDQESITGATTKSTGTNYITDIVLTGVRGEEN